MDRQAYIKHLKKEYGADYLWALDEERIATPEAWMAEFDSYSDDEALQDYGGDAVAWLDDAIRFDTLRPVNDIWAFCEEYLNHNYGPEWYELNEYYHDNGPDDEPDALVEYLYNELWKTGFPDEVVDYTVLEYTDSAKSISYEP